MNWKIAAVAGHPTPHVRLAAPVVHWRIFRPIRLFQARPAPWRTARPAFLRAQMGWRLDPSPRRIRPPWRELGPVSGRGPINRRRAEVRVWLDLSSRGRPRPPNEVGPFLRCLRGPVSVPADPSGVRVRGPRWP